MRLYEFSSLSEDVIFKLNVPSSKSDIENLQRALAAFRYDVEPTGTIDDLTVAAIKRAQSDINLPVTGNPDEATISAINTAMTAVPGMMDYMRNAAIAPPAAKSTAKPASKSTSSSTVGSEPESSREGPEPKSASAKGREVIIGNEKRTGGSISWRTNNPGNVAYSGIAKSYGALGYIRAADGEPVAIMPTLEHGLKLQMAQWRRPKYNNLTINQACRTWATGVGKQTGTSQYTIDMANAAGASIHTKVSDLSDEQLKNMLKKQAKLEGFKVGTVTTV